jgi:hypothetical protein
MAISGILYEVTIWSVPDITSAIDDWHTKRGWRPLIPESLSWFDGALRRALEDGATSRSLGAQQKAEVQALKAREAAKEETLRKVRASEPESTVVQNARDQIKDHRRDEVA